MTLASSLVQITPRGTELAGHAADGKEHLAVVLADASGHLIDTLDTWWVWTGAVTFAANKYFLTGLNAGGSPKVVKVRRLVLVNVQTAAVTGTQVLFEIRKITAQGTATTVTPVAMDSNNAALPAQLAFRTNPSSVTDGALLYVYGTNNEELGALATSTIQAVQVGTNMMMEGPNTQELTLRAGEGFGVKMTTSTSVGSYGVLAIFTVE